MKRGLYLAYGVACHLMFLGTYAYLAAFVSGRLVQKSIDTPGEAPLWVAIIINVILLGLFAFQHSIMARTRFKQLWVRVVPSPIERSTYVLISCLALIVLMWQWRGIDTVIWDAGNEAARAALWALFATGWMMVPLVSLMIDHFDLFGTRQVWLYFRGKEYTPLPFRVPGLYKRVRHPLYLGWALAFWAIPTMTLGHLLFSGTLTLYMGLAALVEERDLEAHFGCQYAEYRRRVPMFIPRMSRLSGEEVPPRSQIIENSDCQPLHCV
jgi:methanethiol S-methyltransferase